MLRIILTSLLFLMYVSKLFSQATDSTPSRWQNYLAVEGGGYKVDIDSITPLDSLIGRLSKKWEFLETGKMYWIGYTEDMFSIAARGDNAIQPLINVLQNSSGSHAKLGAIYCLHLIGINRTIVGRFSEKFVNPKARLALLQSLKDTLLQKDIMLLLQRDAWASDIPYIIETMKSCKTDCWRLVNGLTRYKLNNSPIHQKIPDSILDVSVKLRYKIKSGTRSAFDKQIKAALYAFKRLKKDNLIIEDTLFKSKLAGSFGSLNINPLSIQLFFFVLNFDHYSDLGSRLQYYVADNKLHICSPQTAKQRLIDWWTNLTADEKASYNRNSY